ncbi:hypothetical protein DER45DRAFT_595824 [Fusarium avenaceum]|nr:hypothetical protein DER45DRAFT_595824 [Fusarium avenaceum]
MCQDDIDLEDVTGQAAPAVRDLVLPNSFTIHQQGDSETKFKLRGNAGSSSLSISCTYKSTEDDFEARVNLQSGTDENAPPLATVKYTRHSAELEFINAIPPKHIDMYYQLIGDRNAMYSFGVNLPQRMLFEWRNIGDGEGWKLYVDSKPEVLATGALNMGSDKPTRFEFMDIQAVDELSEECKLVIILSWLRIWDKVRIQFRRAPDEGETELILCSCGFCVIL